MKRGSGNSRDRTIGEITLFFMCAAFLTVSCFHNNERSNKKYTLTCKSDTCIYDSIIVDVEDSIFNLLYYKRNEVMWIESYKQRKTNEYYYINTVHDFQGNEIGTYDYLMFAPIDTTFTFYFDSLGYPPVKPVNSDAWRIKISKRDSYFEIEKTHMYHRSFRTSIKYDFPFRITSIISQNDLGITEFN